MIRELAWAPGLRGFEGSTSLGKSTCMGLTSVLRQQGDSEGFKQGLEKGSDLYLELLHSCQWRRALRGANWRQTLS